MLLSGTIDDYDGSNAQNLDDHLSGTLDDYGTEGLEGGQGAVPLESGGRELYKVFKLDGQPAAQ